MTIDPEVLKAWPLPVFTQSYEQQDVILYALGLGIGQDPLDPAQLQFVYEDGLKTLPTMGAVLGFPGPWLSDPQTGVDYSRVVHGEQHVKIIRPLPVSGAMRCVNTVVDVVDRGPERGAAVIVARDLFDAADNQLVSRQTSVLIARGDGGFGGAVAVTPAPKLPEVPARRPDASFEWRVPLQLALIYRLSGDRNPLHAAPEVARRAGFDRPILHGLATFGIAAFVATVAVCAGDPDKLREIGVRFSSPVIPGDTLLFEIWRVSQTDAIFRARAVERDQVVLNNGRICHAA